MKINKTTKSIKSNTDKPNVTDLTLKWGKNIMWIEGFANFKNSYGWGNPPDSLSYPPIVSSSVFFITDNYFYRLSFLFEMPC